MIELAESQVPPGGGACRGERAVAIGRVGAEVVGTGE